MLETKQAQFFQVYQSATVIIKIYLQSIKLTDHEHDMIQLPKNGCLWGGVVNQDEALVIVDVQRNLNAFTILAENIRVGIVIVAAVDNI
jgi:hypothetical protein